MLIVVMMVKTTQLSRNEGALLYSKISKKGRTFRLTKGSSLQKNKKRSEKTDEERVRDFQRKLYLKAKQEKEFRFYVLYDKVSLGYVLRESYRRAKANKGAPGVDGVTFEEIERTGVKKLL
ncbi:MAG: hypothetical protein DKM50_07515 [Candidatus Margulisiibacteriota bacterium]|nr:MAG: hypothetical protein DKM50_07515 [Candidatus Margulisiibacteriota bacterium]HCY35977.1 hypothetical protein [Candidatus Margulisiibacteriota bacterium]